MKRYYRFAALLAAALMLPGAAALAQAAPVETEYVTITRLAEQAAEGWHETYQSHGREAAVDVDISWMPQADACPVLQVESIQPYPEAWEAVQRIPGINASLFQDIAINVRLLEAVLYPGGQYYGKTDYDQNLQFENGEEPTVDAEASDLTYEEFRARVDHTLSELVGLTLDGFRLDKISVAGPAYKAKERDGVLVRGEQLTTTGYYGMLGTQLFNGIPLLNYAPEQTPGGRFYYTYRSEAWYMYQLVCSKITAVRTADVPLLSFDAIQQVLKAQIEAGTLRGVDEMEFGYLLCYRDTDEGRRWLTMPAWRVLGGYSADLDKEHVMPYYDERDTDGSLTVPMEYNDYYYNAQTGEMLQTRALTESGAALPAGEILTWDFIGE